MKPKELAHLRGVLETRQAELESLLRNRDVIAVDSGTADVVDQIQYATERDMAISNLERESARLTEVRDALARVRLGTYGICLNCEEEISMKRLKAVPYAPLCIVCREAADREQTSLHDAFEDPLLAAA
jgi:DnaK suppressor protein